MNRLFLILSSATILSLTTVAQGQILFSSPVAVTTSDGSQISTLGSFIDAVGANGGGTTVINVGTMAFNPIFLTAQQGDSIISFSGAGFGTNGSGNSDTPFNAVNNGVAYVGDFNPSDVETETVTLNKLTLGDVYQVQVFNVGTFQTLVTGANSQSLKSSYTIGTFTALTTSQTFTYSNDSAANSGIGGVGSIVLRDVTSVPEPSTYALLGFGVAAVALIARMRRLLS
jgi:hypothetical protein